ncbi:hypothetical protein PIB30_075053 [Stylosanthes scabra]|uniref:Uncharacterized protein n=1 Tax=Stylosanthes scabra TaxID=79078 RepID=A0ABU6WN50_9FABA|nr:hypothetical protein [Stylosanthes scabra]
MDQQRKLQQQTLDLNATANEATGSGNGNTNSGDCPGAETSYASDGAGGSGTEKEECRAPIHHERPATARTNSA